MNGPVTDGHPVGPPTADYLVMTPSLDPDSTSVSISNHVTAIICRSSSYTAKM